MIFKPQLAHQILAGTKTQTRRPIKPGEDRCRYRIGNTYAVQPGRGKPALARITITTWASTTVGTIDHQAARAEGFKTTADFKAYWVRLHDRAWINHHTDQHGNEHFTPQDLIDRFDDHHTNHPVWAIAFTLAEEPRFLAARTSRGDYTTQPHLAARGEPEAVSNQWLTKFSTTAEQTKAAGEHADWVRERIELERSLTALEHTAALVDHRKVQAHIRVMRDRIAAIDRELAA